MKGKKKEGREIKGNTADWGVNEVCEWLRDHKLGDYERYFRQHKIDGLAMSTLNESDCIKFLNMDILGDRRRFLVLNRTLHDEIQTLDPSLLHPVSPVSSKPLISPKIPGVLNAMSPTKSQPPIVLEPLQYDYIQEKDNEIKKLSGENFHEKLALAIQRAGQWSWCVGEALPIWKRREKISSALARLLISIAYLYFAIIATSITMVFVHEKVPDKMSPLPDVFLDNVPLIPWAFAACEYIILIMFIVYGTILLFHTHRIVAFRRGCCITASVYLLRCLTMYITSLSVPGPHLRCVPLVLETPDEKLRRAMEIARGFGLSVNGVKTCGDYLFSGHAAALTLLNYSINEYTPASWKGLHMASWFANIFGIVLILSAHEHYSIDVCIAYFIAARVFVNYHSCASSRSLVQKYTIDPIFTYLEEETDGLVPNQYEWPWQPIINIFKDLIFAIRSVNNTMKQNSQETVKGKKPL